MEHKLNDELTTFRGGRRTSDTKYIYTEKPDCEKKNKTNEVTPTDVEEIFYKGQLIEQV